MQKESIRYASKAPTISPVIYKTLKYAVKDNPIISPGRWVKCSHGSRFLPCDVPGFYVQGTNGSKVDDQNRAPIRFEEGLALVALSMARLLPEKEGSYRHEDVMATPVICTKEASYAE